ncbi:unnamed protein product [Linum trigynum]|uniref:Legume lectin domain-containing protein n=1 Tax=Linum trigynum TaxID=586398 RepID=A0AAV2FNU3_9ROSI
MVIYPALTHLKFLTLLFFHFNLLLADPTSTFSFTNFDQNPNFTATIALYGDAKVVSTDGSFPTNSSAIQLTHSVSSSGGRVMYNKPIKLVANGSDSSASSFSTYFSFLISPDNTGDGLAFVMVPAEFDATLFLSNAPFGLSLRSGLKSSRSFVAVEYGSSKDPRYSDLSDDHVGIDVGEFVSVKVRNVSSVNALLSSGKRLHSWVDYEAGSKRLEVRLSQFGGEKPVDPLLSYPIDLTRMWNNDQEVRVGLTSSNGNSSQSCFLYSWSFQLRHFPHWMHSQPLDPKVLVSDLKHVDGDNRRDYCVVRVIAALFLGVGCGALGAFMALQVCGLFGKTRGGGVREEGSNSSSAVVHPMEFEFGYEKVKVMVVDDKAIEDVTKQ